MLSRGLLRSGLPRSGRFGVEARRLGAAPAHRIECVLPPLPWPFGWRGKLGWAWQAFGLGQRGLRDKMWASGRGGIRVHASLHTNTSTASQDLNLGIVSYMCNASPIELWVLVVMHRAFRARIHPRPLPRARATSTALKTKGQPRYSFGCRHVSRGVIQGPGVLVSTLQRPPNAGQSSNTNGMATIASC